MPLTYPGGAMRRRASAELAAIRVMSSTGSVGRSRIAFSLAPRAARAARVASAPRVAHDQCDATSGLAATDLVPTDSVRFIEELVVRRPPAPTGQRDQAKHEIIASGSHGG